MGRWDPLVGGAGIVPPEAKMGAAVGALFLCFFSLIQSLRWGKGGTKGEALWNAFEPHHCAAAKSAPAPPACWCCRLFVHFGFFSKVASHTRAHPDCYPPDLYGHLLEDAVGAGDLG